MHQVFKDLNANIYIKDSQRFRFSFHLWLWSLQLLDDLRLYRYNEKLASQFEWTIYTHGYLYFYVTYCYINKIFLTHCVLNMMITYLYLLGILKSREFYVYDKVSGVSSNDAVTNIY